MRSSPRAGQFTPTPSGAETELVCPALFHRLHASVALAHRRVKRKPVGEACNGRVRYSGFRHWTRRVLIPQSCTQLKDDVGFHHRHGGPSSRGSSLTRACGSSPHSSRRPDYGAADGVLKPRHGTGTLRAPFRRRYLCRLHSGHFPFGLRSRDALQQCPHLMSRPLYPSGSLVFGLQQPPA